MRMTFGMYLDGVDWSNKPASIGEVKLGPRGMLELLETRLGLTAPSVHPAERINQFMQRLEECDGPGKWFHDSFDADPWSTTKQMLFWRDQLVDAGWRGQGEVDGSARLNALSELATLGLPLADGSEDRLQRVLLQLENTSSISVSFIHLHEPLEMLPSVWQKVLSELENLGVRIDSDLPSSRTTSSNLSSVQSIITGESGRSSPRSSRGSGKSAEGDAAAADDSLLLIEAIDEWEAAENLALWLAADIQANRDVTIICGNSTDVLDQALKRHGLPQLGDSDSSRWRASLQVLPLVLANAWQPLDIFRLVELLSLPLAPLPGYAAGFLSRAMSEEPGVGGAAWQDALQKIAEKHQTREEERGNTTTKEEAATFASDLDEFLTKDRFDPETGIPEDKLKQRCQRVIDSLAWRVKEDPMLGEAVSHAREMQKLAAGKGMIPRVAVERMLDSVIGTGSHAPDRFRQAAPWRVVRHPGQVTEPAETLIWWGFIDQPVKPSSYWSETERQSLERAGIKLEDSRTRRSREAHAWRRGFNHAQEHVLLFYPVSMQGEPVYHHPFWDEINIAAAQARPDICEDEIMNCLTRKCAELQQNGHWQLAGRAARLQQAARSEPAKPAVTHAIPQGIIAPPERLSYTQMSTMIGCPMNWALECHAKLRAPAAQSMPTANLMIGNLCHRIVQELFAEPGASWTAEEAHTKALTLYDSLVESMAAELLVEGRELDNSRYRDAIAQAVKQLVEAINRRNLTVEKSEERLEGEFLDEIPFAGYADLLLRDKQGNTFIFDLKWTSTSKYLKKELEEGYALQLATYAWLLKTADPDRQVQTGYYLLAQGELLSDSALLSDETIEMPHSLVDTWEMGSRSWTQRLTELNSGLMEASGLRERQIQAEQNLNEDKLQEAMISERHSQGLLYQQTKCGFCDFATLCGAGGEL